jgi:hypothetical protein
LRNHLPWLCQGDIFADAPVMDVILVNTNELHVSLPMGPSVLLTHDCAMDKPTRSGQPRVERLQFARLRAIDSLPNELQRSLRGNQVKLAPYEALYVGNVADLGESYILLSDPYYLPASYFALSFENYSNHPEAEPGARYVTPQANDTRLGRLDEGQVELLRRKLIAFWARVTE